MSTKKALAWVVFWVALAMCFNAGIYYFMGREKALFFLTGYILEQSFSVDNLFLFLMIFSSFGIRPKYQRRVLTYGILGAIILRLIFIVLGVAVVNKFHAVLYIFGANLVVSGIKMAFSREGEGNVKDSKILKLLGKIIPITPTLKGEKFFVRKGVKLYATPLFAVLVLIELSDIVFAVDSIPAVFSITTDMFIVYTSNIFAILGLRSMYFVLGRLHEEFRYVRYGVAVILTLTGFKLLALMFDVEVPIVMSLAVIAAILILSVLISLAFYPAKRRK